MQQRNVVFHDGRRADYDTRAMVDDDPAAEACGRVDVCKQWPGDLIEDLLVLRPAAG
jgi:hypothetical protein